MKISVCFTVAFALTLAAASAQDSPLAKPLRKFDVNKDGKLTGDEFVQARQAHNRGGREAELSPNNWKEMMERRRNGWRERNQKFIDANGDGKVDDAEKERAESVWKEIAAESEKVRLEILKKYDRNDDGDLTKDEREASRKESETRRQEIEKRIMAAHSATPVKPAP